MATDVITALLQGGFANLVNIVTAVGGLGTAAMGLVDTSKLFGGGPSNFGFGYVKKGLDPFLNAIGTGAAPVGTTATPGGANATSVGAAAAPIGKQAILQTLRSNWLNGVAAPDQKAKAKSLIHLGLTSGSAEALAKIAGVNSDKLQSLAQKIAAGQAVGPDEISVLGQFDAVLSAALDAAYERGDQKYRNAAKFCAMIVAAALGGIGGVMVFGCTWPNFFVCLLMGVVATPLAPISKDLASALQTAVSAANTLKG